MAGRRRVIGARGRLPWPPLALDLQRFRRLTWGQTLILGRRTWDLELHRRPLPGRQMIILSRDPHWAGRYADVDWAGSLEQAVAAATTEQVFVGGGAGIFAEALPLAHRLELTLIEQDYPGDTFFPDYQQFVPSRYQLVRQEIHPHLTFCTYLINSNENYSG